MKNILCYGDSNTWGADPAGGPRFSWPVRWPGVLQRELGDGYRVIEEGLGGRTTVLDDPLDDHKNGKTYLRPCLESHRPLDLVVLMLGTNDLKYRFSFTPQDIAAGAGVLVRLIQASASGYDGEAPRVLLLVPPPVGEQFSERFAVSFEGAKQKAPHLSRHYAAIAQEHGCAFLDTTEFLRASPLDGLHLDAEAHLALGQRVAQAVRDLLE
ncbi:MAG: SGNH/GDSL hydrolase family protein [Chloroflexi bacterium]|nr:SGNH/GDSL hydrolase family protein [Chloroflexota bacterium]